MECKFSYVDSLFNINDSMELDSGQSLAELTMGDITVEIRVEGYVRVVYEGQTYKCASQFPDELREMFHDGTWKDLDEEVLFIDNNNWFEIFLYERGEYRYSDVVDGGWKNPVELFKEMYDFIQP